MYLDIDHRLDRAWYPQGISAFCAAKMYAIPEDRLEGLIVYVADPDRPKPEPDTQYSLTWLSNAAAATVVLAPQTDQKKYAAYALGGSMFQYYRPGEKPPGEQPLCCSHVPPCNSEEGHPRCALRRWAQWVVTEVREERQRYVSWWLDHVDYSF